MTTQMFTTPLRLTTSLRNLSSNCCSSSIKYYHCCRFLLFYWTDCQSRVVRYLGKCSAIGSSFNSREGFFLLSEKRQERWRHVMCLFLITREKKIFKVWIMLSSERPIIREYRHQSREVTTEILINVPTGLQVCDRDVPRN